jgi:hypothetical protein
MTVRPLDIGDTIGVARRPEKQYQVTALLPRYLTITPRRPAHHPVRAVRVRSAKGHTFVITEAFALTHRLPHPTRDL